jgi:two-component system OmpR family response regulator
MTHHLTILLVEDDGPTRELFRATLRIAGFRLMTAADGIAALRYVDQHLPDVIVLDLDLPYVSGIEIHDELAHDPRTRHIPIIVVTGTDWRPHRPPAAILTKPIRLDRLIAAVHRIAPRVSR